MVVRMDDRRLVYPAENLNELEIAYAITVHKSQGSEFPAVILPVAQVPPRLCYRNLFYTGVTRARKLCIVAGRRDVANRMMSNVRQNLRYSGLCALLQAELRRSRCVWRNEGCTEISFCSGSSCKVDFRVSGRRPRLSVTFGDSSPKGRAKGVTGTFLASPFGRGGTPLGVTERARPLPMLAGLCRTPHEGCKTCILFAATMLY